MWMVEQGHLGIVELLVKNKANINKANIYDWTSLMFAVQEGHLDIVKFLVKNKADVNKASDDGWTPLTMAAERKHPHIVKFLLSKGAQYSNLFKLPFEKIYSPKTLNFFFSDKNIKQKNFKKELKTNIISSAVNHGLPRLLIKSPPLPLLHDLKSYLVKYHINLTPKNKKLLQEFIEKIIINKLELLASKYTIKRNKYLMDVDVSSKLCPICRDSVKNSDCIKKLGGSDCMCRICKNCFKNYLNFSIKSDGANIPKCPGCSRELSMKILRKIGISDKVIKILLLRVLKKIPNFKFCSTSDCINGKIFDSKNNFFFCSLCDKSQCIKCGKNHYGDCNKYNMQFKSLYKLLELGKFAPPKKGHPEIKSADPFNKKHAKYFHGRYRPCPKCGVIIEKVFNGKKEHGQCNAMRCKECNTKFDWNKGLNGHSRIWACGKREYKPRKEPHF
jgi:hypothetical protein